MGDVCNTERLESALDGVDYVLHLAACKHIDRGQYNALEYKRIIVDGAESVIKACLKMNIKKVIAISTDKATSASGIYGASKALSDKLFIAANQYSKTQFSIIKYGNVCHSTGSITQTIDKNETSIIYITNRDMTRFFITCKYASKCIIFLLENMIGTELYIPKLATSNMLDFLKVMKPNALVVDINIRPSEKIHEKMIEGEESKYGVEFDQYYILYPDSGHTNIFANDNGIPTKLGFEYTSDNKSWILNKAGVIKMLDGTFYD